MKSTNHRKMLFQIFLCVMAALAILVVFNEDRGTYVVVLFTAAVGFLLLRALERNSRELRSASRKLRDQYAEVRRLNERNIEYGLLLSTLRKEQHSNELRIRRLNDWSMNCTVSIDAIELMMRTTVEGLKNVQATLRDMKRMIDRLGSEHNSNEKRLRLLNESVKSITDDMSKAQSNRTSNEILLQRLDDSVRTLADKAHTTGTIHQSNELGIQKLDESVRSLADKTDKFAINEHSNELRLRRLVEMHQRLEANFIKFAGELTSQNEFQYKSDAFVKYQILEDLSTLKDSVIKSVDI